MYRPYKPQDPDQEALKRLAMGGPAVPAKMTAKASMAGDNSVREKAESSSYEAAEESPWTQDQREIDAAPAGDEMQFPMDLNLNLGSGTFGPQSQPEPQAPAGGMDLGLDPEETFGNLIRQRRSMPRY